MVVNSISTYIPVLNDHERCINSKRHRKNSRDPRYQEHKVFLAVKAWFSYVGKIPDDQGLYGRQKGKAPIVWDFPDIWKPGLTNKKVCRSWRYKMT